MNRKRSWLLVLMALAITAVACSTTTIEVPPAHVAKLQTKSGLAEDIIQPGLIKLQNRCSGCDQIIIAEVSDYAVEESMRVFMPTDQLNLQVDVRGIYRIDPTKFNEVFARIPAQDTGNVRVVQGGDGTSNRVKFITMRQAYETYAKQVVREATRTVLTRHSIIHVMQNRESVGAELHQQVIDSLDVTPLEPTIFGFADIQPPDIIVTANEQKREREIAIERAEAEKLVALTQAEAEREVALKQQEIDLIEAETQKLVQDVLNQSVSPQFVTQRYLRVLQALAENENTVFVPFDALPREGADGGLSFRIFNQDLFEGETDAAAVRD